MKTPNSRKSSLPPRHPTGIANLLRPFKMSRGATAASPSSEERKSDRSLRGYRRLGVRTADNKTESLLESPSSVTETTSEGNIEEYTVGRQLGQGAYATVKYAVHKRTNRKVAVKTYDKVRLLDPSRKKSVHREIKILSKLEHPHIVKLFETIDAPRQLHLVLEYLPGGSLHYHLKRSPNRHLTESEAKRLFRQVLSAMDYCHSLNVTHRDLKLENILLDDRRNIKLIDFGFATCFPNDKKAKIFCGTPSYMSPEIVARKEYNGPPADVWALGVLLFVMLSGTYPFKGRDDKDLYRKILRGQFEIPQVIAAAPRALIHRMMSIDPGRRPSVKELLCDAWLNGLHMSIEFIAPITRTNSTLSESKAIDLDVISKIKQMGYTEDFVMKELQVQESKISKLYRRVKRGESCEALRPTTVAT
eukprot:CAMPEP_0204901482 /NCGR_PEP_ID=MMETSP1397-20131031/3106_1 /ASSEMBLY_ACC=CAM_ASM_000891 /TAXON_ID=49980 /ORGANISM="Climacostomum Climacostomum virens, Strain Stock W-24" /LENGTH=417 /DNA_ID=CAMNT_0052069847 /DNA_START=219 /DNA_END=1472 /DNA_ORIENTATION=+